VAILKKTLKIGGLILGVLLALLLIANAIFISITGSRLEKHLSAIRAAGDPVTLAELKRPMPSPEQNAATYLSRARAAQESFVKETDPVLNPEPAPPYQDQLKAVRAGFAAYPGIIPLLQQAADCPDCNLDLPYDANPSDFMKSLLTNVQQFRSCVGVLSWQSRLLRHDGKLDDAVRTCLTSFRLSRQLQREPPMLISCLVVIACRAVAVEEANAILRAGPISNAVRAELEKELALMDDPASLGRVLKDERALAISHFGPVIPVGWFNRGIANAWECSYLDTLKGQIELVSRPDTEVLAAAAKKTSPTQFDVFSSLGLPAILKVREAWHRMQAQTRCLRIMNAMQQKDVWKDNEINLAKLGLPAETITDPYDGSAIKLKKVKGEWIIYCVGANLKDDGGNLESNKDVNDVGLGPIAAEKR
jgi:hypothetical protein